MAHDVVIVLIGVLVGFFSGLFGIGGSSIVTPLLRLTSVPPLLALASPLPVTLPTALVGGVTYWRKGHVQGRAVLWTALGGVPAVILGAYLTTVVPGRVLMFLTGLVVVAAGARVLRKPAKVETAAVRPPFSSGRFLAVGIGVGLLSGLLANGGGFLLMPAYLLLFRMNHQEAAGTSLVGVALLAIPGTWVHWQLGNIDLRLTLLLTIGVIPSTYLGARLGLTLRQAQARWLFGSFLLLFGLFFLLRTLYRAEVYGWLG